MDSRTRELVGTAPDSHGCGCVFEGLLGMTGLDDLVWYGARGCLVAMFPFSAVDKIWHWKNALAQAASDRLPGAKPMLILAIVVEFVTPICIVAGVYDRIAAFLLSGFCVVTAVLYHPFWAYPDSGSRATAAKRASTSGSFSRILAWSAGYCLSSSRVIWPQPRRCCAHRSRLVGMPRPQRRSRRPNMEAHGWYRSVALSGGL